METTDNHKLINSSPNSSSNFNDEIEPNKQQSVPESDETGDEKVENRLQIDEIDSSKQQSMAESDEKVENDDHVDQSAAHEVSFAFNRLKIDENESIKQQSMAKSDETVDEKVENRLQIDENYSSKQQSMAESVETVDENGENEVSFAFNRLKIDENDSNKQQSMAESPENDENESHKQQFTPESPENDDENGENDEDDEEEEGEFTFMCIGDDDNDSPNSSSEVFEKGQIREVFPLFDQSLLLSGGDSDGGGRRRRRLPIHVPVDKVFVESPRRRSPSSTASGDKSTAAMLCALPNDSSDAAGGGGGGGAPEMNMKSNSTGFSKLWRFRDRMNRSNSDGRDAFVFLEPSRTTTTTTTTSKTTSSFISIGKSNAGDEFDLPEKVNGGGKAKAVKKVKKLTASAHEVYLKQTEDERRRRRTYLPYRPGLMGFFTNVNGGLSKNVHPF